MTKTGAPGVDTNGPPGLRSLETVVGRQGSNSLRGQELATQAMGSREQSLPICPNDPARVCTTPPSRLGVQVLYCLAGCKAIRVVGHLWEV